ncbi:hypothetical protein GCM10009117_22410 [Gangjinia marincola]|uniref:Uncharacterized protein n=1 Tax=Gangjinia marincola TaxID=578463 RepID=A0ABN1MJF9_9FLAO
MEIQFAEPTTDVNQKIQLVQGSFTPSEASHVICSLLDEKINFHKIQRLQMREGDECCETKPLDGRIQELQEEKRIAKEYIAGIRALGKNLKIDGILNITVDND